MQKFSVITRENSDRCCKCTVLEINESTTDANHKCTVPLQVHRRCDMQCALHCKNKTLGTKPELCFKNTCVVLPPLALHRRGQRKQKVRTSADGAHAVHSRIQRKERKEDAMQVKATGSITCLYLHCV